MSLEGARPTACARMPGVCVWGLGLVFGPVCGLGLGVRVRVRVRV